jgi:hypothetical protein
MKTLHAFGCSFTEEYMGAADFTRKTGTYYDYYVARGESFPKNWVDLLAEKLNIPNFINYGRGGSCNYDIFQKFCDNLDKINPGDVVIMGWTDAVRFRISSNDGSHFISIGVSTPDTTWNDNYSIETAEEVWVNRSCSAFTNEIYSFEKLIDDYAKHKGFEVFYWGLMNDVINSEPDEFRYKRKYMLPEANMNMIEYFALNGFESIIVETNRTVWDHHPGQIGYEVMADLFYNDLIKKL